MMMMAMMMMTMMMMMMMMMAPPAGQSACHASRTRHTGATDIDSAAVARDASCALLTAWQQAGPAAHSTAARTTRTHVVPAQPFGC